ncbi:ABC transporter substrate-binding protein [Pseudoduganella namucuonensis]|uniref:Branched-chain amino acid transport system substrate-binding protein n=1 Tax=Pseudoduganella namucuonensis TaxID=1035707 RepID=A0A1I7JDA0_9BURK|nr:ABC transporter substrate-binding protein [Pseudoduganella namucuonensis]SFU83176.1 branched-chain amino acid transport system substrate-binding protein [Pseudoduganella namucuonensis]
MRHYHIIAAAIALGLGTPAAAAPRVSGDVVRIGFLTDLSGVYSDIDGPGGVEAIRMAIAAAGGSIDGKRIELLVADHQNKADIAAGKAREWFDQHGVDMLIGGTNSGTSLAMAHVAAKKRRVFIAVGAGTTRLTNEDCSRYTIHYAFDTLALARGTAAALTRQGEKSWYFISVDYAYGVQMLKDASAVIEAAGGAVAGSVRFPLAVSDFSSYLLQAQASKAQVLGLITAGSDTINAIKAANAFGIGRSMKLAGLAIFISDIHTLGLHLTQGMYVTDGWYWDQSPASRAWSARYFAKMKRMPTMLQAGDYSAALQYLQAVKAIGSDDPDKVLAYLKRTTLSDMFTSSGTIRPDGRMVHDMYLMQVKAPSQSMYPWDYYKVLQTIRGDDAFTARAETRCALWK